MQNHDHHLPLNFLNGGEILLAAAATASTTILVNFFLIYLCAYMQEFLLVRPLLIFIGKHYEQV